MSVDIIYEVRESTDHDYGHEHKYIPTQCPYGQLYKNKYKAQVGANHCTNNCTFFVDIDRKKNIVQCSYEDRQKKPTDIWLNLF